MSKKIDIIGADSKRIEVLDQPKRCIDPAELAAALGANPIGRYVPGAMDLIDIAELGAQLIRRQQTGGGPSPAEAIACPVTLSAEDLKTLETMVSQITVSTGSKPTVGQVVSVIVHRYLAELGPGKNSGAAAS